MADNKLFIELVFYCSDCLGVVHVYTDTIYRFVYTFPSSICNFFQDFQDYKGNVNYGI